MNKIMEYMAMSRPIVSFDLREARVSAGDAAVYATPNDESEFAKHISALLDDPDLRRRMGEIGRARVAGELSWDRSRIALIAAYEAAIATPDPSSVASRRRDATAGVTGPDRLLPAVHTRQDSVDDEDHQVAAGVQRSDTSLGHQRDD
jgi:hypothetical protein